MAFDPSQHPRAAAGAAGGGEFAAISATGEGTQTKAKKGAGKGGAKGGRGRRKAPRSAHGSLGMHAGYGQPGGDKRVKALQAALNKLGIKDAQGHPLKLDGMLGPKTTAAIKAWQSKHGMKPTGTITAAALHRLTSGKAKTRHATAHLSAKKAPLKRPGSRPAARPAKPAPRPRTIRAKGKTPTLAFTQ